MVELWFPTLYVQGYLHAGSKIQKKNTSQAQITRLLHNLILKANRINIDLADWE